MVQLDGVARIYMKEEEETNKRTFKIKFINVFFLNVLCVHTFFHVEII